MTAAVDLPGDLLDPARTPISFVLRAPEPVLADGWTDERIIDFWRRTARARMLSAFAESGVSDETYYRVRTAFETVLQGGPRGTPLQTLYPFYRLADEGAARGFAEAAEVVQPAEPEEPERPTVVRQGSPPPVKHRADSDKAGGAS